ncbi:MAG: serine hydrolase domain-containing protein, partial [Acidobacteriota bacterium]
MARFLKDETGGDRFSGTVILARENQILYEESFGQASREQGTANTPDTLFRFASLTKMFTGLAISLLVENGRIAFEDPVGKFLADLPNRQIREQVTIHQLLTHTGGLNSFTLVNHHGD